MKVEEVAVFSLPSVTPCAAQQFKSIFQLGRVQKEPELEFILR